MQKYVETVDIGVASEVFVTGISQIEQIGPNTVRVTLHSSREGENVAVLHTVWDLEMLLENIARLQEAADTLGVKMLRRRWPQVVEAH